MPTTPQADDDEATATSRPPEEELTARVADVVKAAINAGTAVARSVVRATGETGDTDGAGRPGDNPLTEFVRVGADAVGGMVRLVVSDIGKTVRARPGADTSGDPGAGRPTVHAGSGLRAPLLVENQGSTPLAETGFLCLGVDRLAGDPGPAPGVDDVRFQPETLSVAARDFEKLTVTIATPLDAAPGSYRAHIAAQQGGFATDIDFDIVAT